jgi:nucleoside-diphosphate-sugar epimerase
VTRILVTGATGFVGRHTLEPLCRGGWEVHAVSRTPRRSLHGERWHALDLFDRSARHELLECVTPSRLLHLAWTVEHGRFWDAPINRQWQEVTLGLVEEFAEVGGRRLVAAGTCAEYDWSALGGEPCREFDTPCRPGTVYGSAKHELRIALESLARRRAVSFAWGRLFHLFGPGEHRQRLVPALAVALLAGRTAATGPGHVIRDFLDVREAGAAFVALLNTEVEGPVNIASGTPTTITALAETLADTVGRRELLSVGSLARVADPLVLYADVARLTEEVQFRLTWSQEAALRDAMDWWRGQLDQPGGTRPS